MAAKRKTRAIKVTGVSGNSIKSITVKIGGKNQTFRKSVKRRKK